MLKFAAVIAFLLVAPWCATGTSSARHAVCNYRTYPNHPTVERPCSPKDKCGMNDGKCLDTTNCKPGLECTTFSPTSLLKCCRCKLGRCGAGGCQCTEGEGVCMSSSECVSSSLECRSSDPRVASSPKRCCPVRDKISFRRRTFKFCTELCKCGYGEEGCATHTDCGGPLSCRSGRCCEGVGVHNSKCDANCKCHKWYSCVRGRCKIDASKVPKPRGQCKDSSGKVYELFEDPAESAADCKCQLIPGGMDCIWAVWSASYRGGVCQKYYQRQGVLGRWSPPSGYLPPRSRDLTADPPVSSVTYKMECRDYIRKVSRVFGFQKRLEEILGSIQW